MCFCIKQGILSLDRDKNVSARRTTDSTCHLDTDGVNCRLQVAGRRLQVAGCRLQVRISLKCGRSWIAFCFVVSHLPAQKKTEVEISAQYFDVF